MGRRKIPIDHDKLLQLRCEGKSLQEISTALDVSIPTLSRRIAELEHAEGLLTRYRELQGLQLTMLQARILGAITPERIATASIVELALCFHVLKKAELAIQGRRASGVIANLAGK